MSEKYRVAPPAEGTREQYPPNAWHKPSAEDLASPPGESREDAPSRRMEMARSIEDRMSDFRSGYSSGYADAKAGEEMQDEVSAARFLNLPVWNVEVCYYDVAATDDDGFCMHDETVSAPDEATAVEMVEAALRIRVPSAHVLGERTTATREGSASPDTPRGARS